MISIESTNLRYATGKSTLFSQIGSPALDQVTMTGVAGKCYVPLSGLLQVGAYLYETWGSAGTCQAGQIIGIDVDGVCH